MYVAKNETFTKFQIFKIFFKFFHDLFSPSMTWEYRGLLGVTGGYKGLQGVTGGYKRLQGVTGGDKG